MNDSHELIIIGGGPAGLTGRALREAAAADPELAPSLAHLAFRSA